jgi:hypothetical protein
VKVAAPEYPAGLAQSPVPAGQDYVWFVYYLTCCTTNTKVLYCDLSIVISGKLDRLVLPSRRSIECLDTLSELTGIHDTLRRIQAHTCETAIHAILIRKVATYGICVTAT